MSSGKCIALPLETGFFSVCSQINHCYILHVHEIS
jgi:hypothetical protein